MMNTCNTWLAPSIHYALHFPNSTTIKNNFVSVLVLTAEIVMIVQRQSLIECKMTKKVNF